MDLSNSGSLSLVQFLHGMNQVVRNLVWEKPFSGLDYSCTKIEHFF